MKSQPQSVAQASHACAAWANTALFSTKLLGLLAFWMAFAGLQLQAQPYTQYDLSDFVHAVNGPSSTLSEGDTATFEVTLGDEDATAYHVMGMQLDLSLSNLAQIPNVITISVDGSWCFDVGNLYSHPTVGDASLSLLVQTADGSTKSGAGFVFSFQLIATQNDVEPLDMITAIDGIVIVENIDVRIAQYPQGNMLPVNDFGDESETLAANASAPLVAEESAPLVAEESAPLVAEESAPLGAVASVPLVADASAPLVADASAPPVADASMRPKPCFPNPTQGRLQLPWTLEPGMQVQLIGTDGQTYLLDAQYHPAATSLDITRFPAGAYQLVVLCSGRAIYRDRILKI